MNTLKHLFSKRFLLLTIIFTATNFATAQSSFIHELVGINPNDAIVRHWTDTKYVIYSEKEGFVLADANSMIYIQFASTLRGVKDFEIEKDMVYFCGKDASGPMFGYFSIPTLFFLGSGMMKTNLGAWTASYYTPYQEKITDLIKLSIQECPDGVHLYMVGKAEFTGTQGGNRCMVDVLCPGGIPTQCFYAQEQWSVYHYDDIEVTNCEVVLIGHKNGSAGYYNSSYVKPTYAFQTVFPSFPSFTQLYYVSGNGGTLDGCIFVPNKPLMIEHLFGDYYAIVGHAHTYVNNVYDRGTVISIYNTSANHVYRCYVSQGFSDTASWRLRDFRYNKNTGKLYLLQDMSQPVSTTVNSVMCVFDVTSIGTITSATAYYEPSVPYTSLDQCDRIEESVVVGGIQQTRLWRHNSVDRCVTKIDMHVNALSTDNTYSTYEQCPLSERLNCNEVAGELFQRNIATICNQ